MKLLISPPLLARVLAAALLLALASFPYHSASAQSPYFPNTQPTYNPYGFGRYGINSYGVGQFQNSANAPLGMTQPRPWLAQQLYGNPTFNNSRGIRNFSYGGGYNSNYSPYGNGRY